MNESTPKTLKEVSGSRRNMTIAAWILFPLILSWVYMISWEFQFSPVTPSWQEAFWLYIVWFPTMALAFSFPFIIQLWLKTDFDPNRIMRCLIFLLWVLPAILMYFFEFPFPTLFEVKECIVFITALIGMIFPGTSPLMRL